MKSRLIVRFDDNRSEELVELLRNETNLKKERGRFAVFKLDDQVAVEIWTDKVDSMVDLLKSEEFAVDVPPDIDTGPPKIATALAGLGELIVFQEGFTDGAIRGERAAMDCESTSPGPSAEVTIRKAGPPENLVQLEQQARDEALRKAGRDAVEAAQALTFTCQNPCKHLVDIVIGKVTVTSTPGSTSTSSSTTGGSGGVSGTEGETVTEATTLARVSWQTTKRCARENSISPAYEEAVAAQSGAGSPRCPIFVHEGSVRSDVQYQCGTDLTGQTFLVHDRAEACEDAKRLNLEKVQREMDSLTLGNPCPAVNCPNFKIYFTISKPICIRYYGTEDSLWEQFWGVGDGRRMTCNVQVTQYINMKKVCSG